MRTIDASRIAVISLVALLVSFYGSAFAQALPLTKGEVNAENINIRADSTAGSEIICAANKTEQLEIISEAYGWYKIKLPKNAPSFVSKSLVECANIEPPRPAKNSSGENPCLSAKALKNGVNIRLRPDLGSPVIGKINKDKIVKVLKDEGEWYRIEPSAESFGWINAKFVTRVSGPSSPAPAEPPKSKIKNKGR